MRPKDFTGIGTVRFCAVFGACVTFVKMIVLYNHSVIGGDQCYFQ